MEHDVEVRRDRRRARGDDGVIGLIPAIIALLVGAAAAAVTIVAVSRSTSRIEPKVYLAVNDVVATRDAHGRPHVHIKYRVAVAGDRAGAFTPEARVTCSVVEAGGRSRVFIGEAGLFVADGAPATRH
jgi:hypothetical protein